MYIRRTDNKKHPEQKKTRKRQEKEEQQRNKNNKRRVSDSRKVQRIRWREESRVSTFGHAHPLLLPCADPWPSLFAFSPPLCSTFDAGRDYKTVRPVYWGTAKGKDSKGVRWGAREGRKVHISRSGRTNRCVGHCKRKNEKSPPVAPSSTATAATATSACLRFCFVSGRSSVFIQSITKL